VISYLQQNFGAAIYVVLALAGAFVFTAVALLMRRGGQSLRPVVFVAVFYSIAVVPGLVHAYVGYAYPAPVSRMDLRDLQTVFGPDADPALIRDAKGVYADALVEAQQAKMAFWPTGETMTAARFANESVAREASARLWRLFRVTNTGGSEETGWWATRQPSNDVISMRLSGNALLFWTGSDRQAVENRIARSRLKFITTGAAQPWFVTIFQSLLVRVMGVVLLIILATAWFFWGFAWAVVTGGRGDPVGVEQLRERLSQLHPSVETNRWEIVTTYRASGTDTQHKIVLVLDEKSKCVRVTEFIASSDNPSGDWNKRVARGVVFFQKDMGVDLQKIKKPYLDAVTNGGWTWQPDF